MSKIGVHSIIGPRNGYGAFLKRIADAGQTLAVVKVLDDFGPAKEAKDLMPNTLTVGRFNTFKDKQGNTVDTQGFEPRLPDGSYRDAREVAEWYFERLRDKWKAHPFIDVWETFNEFSAHWAWQGEFYVAMMDLAEPDGFKLAHYACSTGNPPNAAAAREMIPCLQATKQRGHYLSLHEYGGVGDKEPGVSNPETLRGTEPNHALRYRALYETILIPNNADPPLILSEIGQAGGFRFQGTQVLLDDMKWYDSELFKDEYVVGAAIFTLGKWMQTTVNYQEALPALADYIATTPTPAPPPRPPRPVPPPPPPEPPVEPQPPVARARGAPRAQYRRTYLLLPNEPATPDGNARLSAWIQAVVASGVLTRYRWTMGSSADDAGIGDLDRRGVIAINPETWPTSLAEFYAREYPGVNYDSIQAATPDALRDQLANMAFG
jgi:hypothetical protein